MTHRQSNILAVLVAVAAVGGVRQAGAKQTPGEPVLGPFAAEASGREGLGEDQRRAVDWLAEYASVQILFHPTDLEALRAKVAAMNEEQARQWLKETEPLRSKLDSDRWRTTRLWFHDFLTRTSGGDERLASLRDETARMSSTELRDLLLQVERQRARLLEQHVRSDLQRQQRLALTHSIAQRERALRNEAIRRPYNAVHPMNFSPPGRQRASRYHLPAPLITSRDVARVAVWAAVFGDWCD